MSFVADLHIHSKYSRACSRDCDLEHLAWWAQRKGIALVGTGDFTHPAWYEHLRDTLVPAGPGVFKLNDELDRAVTGRVPASCRAPVRFMLSVEISTIYKRGERTRKVHHLVYMPDLDAAARFNARLGRIGNITSDGRPILGLDSRDLLEITLEASPDAYLIPAHVWTPWFAVLGSKSGFDSVAECYDDLAGHIFAVETGLSSDPEMNWRVSSLDRYTLVSNSDAHSPPMLGREATMFATEPDYPSVRRALETRAGFGGTIEFFPEEGKYHADGHRKCGVRLDPVATRELDGRCPGCGGPLTVGVLHRVETLADRPAGVRPEGAAPVRSLVQLPEILGEIAGVGAKSKAVARELDALTAKLGPELAILGDLPLDTIAGAAPAPLVEAIRRLRRGEVIRDAGYDGEYGVIRLFAPDELKELSGATALFEPPPPVATPKREVRVAPAARSGPEPAGPVGEAAPAAASAGDLDALAAGPPLRGLDAEAGDDGLRALPQSSPLRGLDPAQRAAAAVAGRPVLIIAGPGTGKTRTLTTRIAHLVAERGVAPERCLAITFTRRAAEELRERLGALLPGGAGDRVEVATFHSLGLAIVREQHAALGLAAGVRVADEAERLALATEALGAGSRRDAVKLVADLSARKRARAMVPAAARDGDELLDRWDAALRARGLVDFDDLVALPVALLEDQPALAEAYRARWPFLSVDEYQDVDALQYRLLRLLAEPDGELCAIGDPDQAIYGFRGADVGFFLRFSEDFPSAAVVQLTRNYRSTAAVVSGALAAIGPATLVPGRALTPVAAPAGPERITVHRAASEAAEAEFVVRTVEELIGGSSFHSLDTGRSAGHGEAGLGFGDVAVLYRTDAQSGALTEALGRAGVPFQKRSHDRVADRPGVPAIVAALRAGVEAPGGASVLTMVRLAARAAAGKVTVAAGSEQDAGRLAAEVTAAAELLAPLAGRCGDLDAFLDELALGAEVDTLDPRAERIALLTLHAAKGLEFPVVFLAGCEDGLLPLRWSGAAGDGRGDVAEERRLLFVGMTRARSHLFLTGAARRLRHGVVRETAPSPFLGDIGAGLLATADDGAGRRAAAPGDQLRLL